MTASPTSRLRHFCSPYHTNSALYPIIAQLERAAGFAPDDSRRQKLDKLEALLGQATAADEAVAAYCGATVIPTASAIRRLMLSPAAAEAAHP